MVSANRVSVESLSRQELQKAVQRLKITGIRKASYGGKQCLIDLIQNRPLLVTLQDWKEIAKKMGVSLGKTNYCLKALLDRGFIKIRNFYNNKHKKAYIYFLTPSGIDEKAQVTYRFLQSKIQEYETIKVEIENLKSEAVTVKNFDVKEKDAE